MKLHLRHPEDERKTRCGRLLKGRELAKASTPDDERCQTCEDSWQKDDAEFRELAEIISDAWWRLTGRVW